MFRPIKFVDNFIGLGYYRDIESLADQHDCDEKARGLRIVRGVCGGLGSSIAIEAEEMMLSVDKRRKELQ